MNKFKNKIGMLKNSVFPARENASAVQSDICQALNPLNGAIGAGASVSKAAVLCPTCPNDAEGQWALSPYQLKRFVKLVVKHLNAICANRKAAVDFEYWGEVTQQILGIASSDEVVIVPARAGAGKSTWIAAFLRALTELQTNRDPLAEALGGVLLVVQKVETLNEIAAELERAFPHEGMRIMAALQGWTPSSQRAGYCPNRAVERFEDCQRDKCPYASRCGVLAFRSHAEESYIVGITQARFGLLRQSADGLDHLLTRVGAKGSVTRRFIIFDEKFEMAQQTMLDLTKINNASSALEKCGQSRDASDKRIRGLETGLSLYVNRPFETLRRNSTIVCDDGQTRDQPFGLCTLSDQDASSLEDLKAFASRFEGTNAGFLSQPLHECIEVTRALHEKRCLFTRYPNFNIVHSTPPQLSFGNSQTIVFDATAEADGDYKHLSNLIWLPSSPAKHLRKLTFHLYRHNGLNVSRSAMSKPWKLPAFAQLTDDILREHPGRTFLCCYRDLGPTLAAALADETLEQMARMPNSNKDCLPYFGGTNGANDFRDCTNVILLGYPRLPPSDYLAHAYTYWGEAGFADDLSELADRVNIEMQTSGKKPPRDLLRQLPMLLEYEAMHLASRLEQEIYRCALRKHDCEDEIHVFMFAPPERVWGLLHSRFGGCHIDYIDDLPRCFDRCKAETSRYKGKPTTYNRLLLFFSDWDGQPITPAEIQVQADISKSAWKELQKGARMQNLLQEYGVVREGRGPNVLFMKKEAA